MTCRDCQYLCVPPDADGKRRVRTGNTYQCVAPYGVPMPPLAKSITTYWAFDWATLERNRKSMSPNDGAGCPVFKFKRRVR